MKTAEEEMNKIVVPTEMIRSVMNTVNNPVLTERIVGCGCVFDEPLSFGGGDRKCGTCYDTRIRKEYRDKRGNLANPHTPKIEELVIYDILESALLWLIDNPILPPKESVFAQYAVMRPSPPIVDFTLLAIEEWQKRMFLDGTLKEIK